QATGDAKFIDETALQAVGAHRALQQLMREPQAGRRFLLEFPGGPPRELRVATFKRGDDVLDAIVRHRSVKQLLMSLQHALIWRARQVGQDQVDVPGST